MLDEDLARIYCVTTKQLNQQLKRNEERFPVDFAFQLTAQEVTALRSQIATSNVGGHDETLAELVSAIRQLIDGPEEAEGPKRQIGFHVKDARNGKEAVGI